MTKIISLEIKDDSNGITAEVIVEKFLNNLVKDITTFHTAPYYYERREEQIKSINHALEDMHEQLAAEGIHYKITLEKLM